MKSRKDTTEEQNVKRARKALLSFLAPKVREKEKAAQRALKPGFRRLTKVKILLLMKVKKSWHGLCKRVLAKI
jgi:hypothetical protein